MRSASAHAIGFRVRLMKPGPAIDFLDQIVATQARCDPLGQFARLRPCLLGKHHRGIGRHVAVRGVARRLDDDSGHIDAGGPAAFGAERGANRLDTREHVGKQMQCWSFFGPWGRRLTQIGGRVKKPLMLGQGETVGHAGDEIADPPGPGRLALAIRAAGRQPLGRQLGRIAMIAREQIEQDLLGLPMIRITRECRYILSLRKALMSASASAAVAEKAISCAPCFRTSSTDFGCATSSRRRVSTTTAPIRYEIRSRTSSAPRLMSSSPG